MKQSSKKSSSRRETATTSAPKTTAPAAEEKPVAPEPVVEQSEATVVEQTTVGEKVVTKTTDMKEDENHPVNLYLKRLNQFVLNIKTINNELKDLVSVGKGLEKDFNSIQKLMAKKSKTRGSERRHPSGFAVASILSEEMYNFLNISKGEKVPRKDVTRMMNDYITKNNLRDPSDKRIIVPNDALHKIFNSTCDDKITYFNLQSYIKHHFIKEQAAH